MIYETHEPTTQQDELVLQYSGMDLLTDSAKSTAPGKECAPCPTVILGLDANGYGIAKGLMKEKAPIYGVFKGADEFARTSRLIQATQVDPGPGLATQVCEIILDVFRITGMKPVIFVTSDEYASIMATHRGLLEDACFFHWVSGKLIHRVTDKIRMTQFLADSNIPLPKTHQMRRHDKVEKIARHFPYPCIIKPVDSFSACFPAGQKNFVAATPQELIGWYGANPQAREHTALQEVIPGEDDQIFQCTVLASPPGRVRAFASVRKLRQYLPGYGITSFGRTEMNAEVTNLAFQIIEKLNWHGLASLEFKYRAQDDTYYFIEMNPRLPWYSGLFADAEINLALMAYKDLAQPAEALHLNQSQREGVHWMSGVNDAASYFRSHGGSKAAMLAWLGSLARTRSFSWLHLRDPMPFLQCGLHTIRHFREKRRQGRPKQ